MTSLDHVELDRLLRICQDGVVSRRQLLRLGARDHDIERMLRRRDLTLRTPGVYVDHTGPLSRAQLEWAAVLALWPAALAGDSALPGPSPAGVVEVAIDARRTARALPGIVVTRVHHLVDRLHPWPSHRAS